MDIPFVHIQARGTHRELGRAIGEGAREQIRASLSFFADNFAAMTEGRLGFAQAELLAQPYGEQARRWLPELVAELQGMAEGANVPYSQLLVLNCGEELISSEPVAGQAAGESLGQRPAEGPAGGRPAAAAAPESHGSEYCTAVAVATAGRHVVGHNMDWYVIDAVNNVLFDLTVPDGTRIMGIAGAPYLLMLGMTSHGVGNVSNSVHSADNVIGVPNAFVRRWSLQARTVDEARARGLLAARARGTNHVLADTAGHLWNMETSAGTSALTDHTSAGYLAHTNHYVSPEMAACEGASYDESRVRLATAEGMLGKGVARGDDPIDLVTAVLRCHDPSAAEAICGHAEAGDPPGEQGMTVGSMICDLDERRVHVCAGPPCENQYRVYEM
jgi:isopenicillin-N N-acyltransferase like protein